jgi:hypothetical protein
MPTAGQRRLPAGTVSMFASPGLASCCRRPIAAKLEPSRKHVKVVFLVIVGALLFGLYAAWDEPTKAERALAAKTASLIAAQYGNLPLHNNAAPVAIPKTYAFRAARHGLVVFVTYGLTAQSERAKLRDAAKKALDEIPELEAVSLESYDDHVISGKARFSSRETVLRNSPVGSH